MEEDIKILVDLIFEIKKLGLDEEKAQAIENLINRVKELEEAVDNFMQGKAYSTKQLENVNKNYIPKSKIREKIEELKIKKGYMVIDEMNEIIVKTLQELLEDK